MKATLPPALAPWAELLAPFPRALALALGPMLRRLASAVGPMPGPAMGSAGEPDGYDGIDRRGPFERLLVSEWLLHEELPDEFARRAAAGELSFLRLAHRRPAASRRSVVLFDAGPDQVGAPRLAHLALLIVLGRRAEAAGAALQWGVLQDEPPTPRDGTTPADVHALIDARTHREPAPAHVDAWREALALHGADELWIVGGAAACSLPAGGPTTRVQIADAPEPEERAVVATLRRGGSRSPVRLPLPGDADCVRLLRDPFASRPRPMARPGPAADIEAVTWSVKSTRLMIRASDGSVLAQTIPGTPRDPARPADRIVLPTGLLAAGVGFAERRPVVVSIEHGAVVVHFRSRKGRTGSMLPFRTPEAPAVPAPGAPLGAFFKLRASPLDGPWGLFLDGDGALFGLDLPGYRGGVAAPILRGVRAIAQTPQHLVAAVREEDGAWRLKLFGRGAPAEEHCGDAFPGGAAFIGYGSVAGGPLGGPFLALQRGPRAFDVHWGRGRTHTLVIPSETSAAGVLAIARDVPALLIVEEDRRTLAAVSTRRSRTLLRSSAPIVHAAASPYSGHVACVDVAGELVVYSLRREAVVLRLRRGVEVTS